MYEFPGSRWMLSCLLSPLLRSSLLSAPIPEPRSFKLKLKKQNKKATDTNLSVYSCTHEWSTKNPNNSVYLFIKGKVPSLPRLWLRPGVARFAGSENIILSIVHVVETFGSNTKKKSDYSQQIYYK